MTEKQCPLLEQCKKVSGINCQNREFTLCDFHNNINPNQPRQFWQINRPLPYIRNPSSQSEITRKANISKSNKERWQAKKLLFFQQFSEEIKK